MSNFLYTHGQPPRGVTTARLHAGIVMLIGAAGLTAGLAVGQVPAASVPVATPGVTVDASAGLPTPSATNPLPTVHPNWAELITVQQRIFVPLAPEWNGVLELVRKKRLQVVQAYPKYMSAQQQRPQTRMVDQVKLTPEQCHRARENFQITKSLPVRKKSEAWQSYQQLTEEQEKALVVVAKVQKHPSAVTALSGGAGLAKDAAKSIHHDAYTKPGTTKSVPINKAAATVSTPAVKPAPEPAAVVPALVSAPLMPVYLVALPVITGGELDNPPSSTVLGG